jgi:hypothetical protein
MRKIDEVKHEIFQLENNIQFFTNTRNAKKENSIEVRKTLLFIKKVRRLERKTKTIKKSKSRLKE